MSFGTRCGSGDGREELVEEGISARGIASAEASSIRRARRVETWCRARRRRRRARVRSVMRRLRRMVMGAGERERGPRGWRRTREPSEEVWGGGRPSFWRVSTSAATVFTAVRPL